MMRGDYAPALTDCSSTSLQCGTHITHAALMLLCIMRLLNCPCMRGRGCCELQLLAYELSTFLLDKSNSMGIAGLAQLFQVT